MLARLTSCLSALSLLFVSPALAQPPQASDYYHGKTISLYVAGAGALELHSRLIAPFLTKHIPGNPVILVRSMPGAGGATLANYMDKVAPKDGTAIANLLPYIAIIQAVGGREARYDAGRFAYLGSIAPINSVLATWNATTPAKNFAEMKEKEVVLGSTGRSSITYIAPTIANRYLGTKFKIVTGYQGTAPLLLAMERSEVSGRVADFEGMIGVRPDWLEKKVVTLHFHTGMEPDPAMPGIPRLIEFAQNDFQRDILHFLSSASALGRVFIAPPDTPAEHVATLRTAFMAAVNDPEYRAFLKDRRLLVDPKTGAQLEKIVAQTLSTRPEIISELKDIFAAEDK